MYHNAILSTIMLYHYDKTIFDLFRVPGDIEKQNVVDAILLETAEMSVIYPSPEDLKKTIGVWTNKNFDVWNELYKTLHYEYNPIHNYDRTEEGRDILDGTNLETRDLTNKDNYSRELQDSNDHLTKVGAYNNGMSEANQETGTINYTGTTEDTKRNTGTVKDKTDNINSHYFRAYGNIGVTTTQEMIMSQREVVQFNLTDYIVNDYKKFFCLAVY